MPMSTDSAHLRVSISVPLRLAEVAESEGVPIEKVCEWIVAEIYDDTLGLKNICGIVKNFLTDEELGVNTSSTWPDNLTGTSAYSE